MSASELAFAPPEGSPRDQGNRFYQILGGGARMKALEAFLDLKIPELLGKEGPMVSTKICEKLDIVQNRGWKFLHLLALAGLLEETNGTLGSDDTIFGLSAQAKFLFGEDGYTAGYFFRDYIAFHRAVADLPFVDVLQGLPLPDAVCWPPRTFEHAAHLETWMTVTAHEAITTLHKSDAVRGGKALLDVGGGDGSIGCAMFEIYKDDELKKVTVFNLPNSAFLARKAIAAKGLKYDVTVHEGDFLIDELPTGFDRILYSRVLCDWSPEVCLMQFQKANRALLPGGKLIINEGMLEGNLEFSISWEYRYIFYDTFGRAMYKPLEVYRKLLSDAGFEIIKVSPMTEDAFYSVIEAVVVTSLNVDGNGLDAADIGMAGIVL